jgi:hypothetical protein
LCPDGAKRDDVTVEEMKILGKTIAQIRENRSENS